MQDLHRFNATSVSCFSENGMDIIGLSDDDLNPAHFAVLMQFREEACAVAQCTELQTEKCEHPIANALQAIKLSRQQMRIVLTDEAKLQLGCNAIEIGLPERYEHPLLVQYLRLCFDNTPIALNIDD